MPHASARHTHGIKRGALLETPCPMSGAYAGIRDIVSPPARTSSNSKCLKLRYLVCIRALAHRLL
jgi:hypothetical protein